MSAFQDTGHDPEILGKGAVTFRPYLAIDGKETPPEGCRLERSDSEIRVSFHAPRDGVWRFGLAITGKEITPLAPLMPKHTAESLREAMVFRYPYDWTDIGQNNVLMRPRLAMPGIMAGGKAYLADTHELTAISLEPAADGQLRALLLDHRFYNDGADAASPDLPLTKDQTRALRIRIFDDVGAVNQARSGAAPLMKEKWLAAVFYRGWTEPLLKEPEYAEVARRLQGVYDYVMIREAGDHAWVPSLFHSRGMKVMDYQYLGALRRNSPQVTQDVQANIGLKGSDGALYSSPTAPDGNWLLTDIRRPEARAVFVANARKAIADGFDAVFVDGYIFWRDAAGRIGGNVPQAEHSLAYARWQLLSELREAVHAANPGAMLGILGNRYYDALGTADFILKERMYGVWDDFATQFHERTVSVCQNMDLDYENGEAPYAPKTIIYGFKGISPICVQSALHFLRRPRGPFYISAEDFFPEHLSQWLDTQRAIATQDDLYITRIDPLRTVVHFEGVSTIWAKQRCEIEFSIPARIRPRSGKTASEPATELKMTPDERYDIDRR